MEYKKLPYFIKELDEATRTVIGIFAVHGNVDAGGDMSEPGLFAKGLADGSRDRVRFLWMHNSYNPPIASIKQIREVTRDELPEKVIAWAPAATGGVEVTRKYYEGVELADWVFNAVREGDVTEMSYAYDPTRVEMVDDEARPKLRRILKEADLYDISDVNWGMNPATAGIKGLPVAGMTFMEHSGMVGGTLQEFVMRVQDRKAARELEGRTLSGPVRGQLAKMVTDIETILRETEPKADPKAVASEYVKFLRNQSEPAMRVAPLSGAEK